MESLQAALAIRRKLADANPTVTDFQRDLAASYTNISLRLSGTGNPAEALKAQEAALAIQRKLVDANPAVTDFQRDLAASHNEIGYLLIATGKPAESRRAQEEALAIRRRLAREHPEVPDDASNLGGMLNNVAMFDLGAGRFEEARAQLREAVACQRKALAANPANPTYRRFLVNHLDNLTRAAQGLGDPEGVAKAQRELAKLRDSDPATVALDAKLAAIIKGDQQPKGTAARLQLARRAYDKALHATAARLWGEAVAAEPKLGDDRVAQHRYNAACAAALAASGRGKDDPPPDDAARKRLREQALGWLRAELTAWKKVAITAGPGDRPLVASTLTQWKTDADLAGVRDATALTQLPEGERKGWQALWADVDSLSRKVGQ